MKAHLCCLCFLLFGCRPASTEFPLYNPVPSTNSSDFLARRSIGRYQILSDDAGLFKIDTATGNTWRLSTKEPPSWEPLDANSANSR